MCDFLPGELIVSYHRDDAAARWLIQQIQEGMIEHVSYIEGMRSRLDALGFVPPEDFQFELHLLGVPSGEEIWKTNYLRFFYMQQILGLASQGRLNGASWSAIGGSETQLLLTPNASLSLCQPGPGVQFQFNPISGTYKGMLGLPHPSGSTGAGVTVAIIDTGLDPATGIAAATGSRNFHQRDATRINEIDDAVGHGTVVSSIVHDVAPDANLIVLKVGDSDPITEWNVLAALLATGGADVVNISLAYGMPFRDCPTCGRNQTHSSRSAVFEQAIRELLRVQPETIVVAAAGNRRNNKPDFPARFADVVAVGATDSKTALATYSNYGATDQYGTSHDLMFFAPGGGNGEFVATTANPRRRDYEGTSFAAPYAAGLIALHLAQSGQTRDRATTLSHFKKHASGRVAGLSGAADFGHGMIHT